MRTGPVILACILWKKVFKQPQVMQEYFFNLIGEIYYLKSAMAFIQKTNPPPP